MSNESYERAEPSDRSTAEQGAEGAVDDAALRAAFVAGYKQALRDTAKPVVFDERFWMDRRGLEPEARALEYVTQAVRDDA